MSLLAGQSAQTVTEVRRWLTQAEPDSSRSLTLLSPKLPTLDACRPSKPRSLNSAGNSRKLAAHYATRCESLSP